MRQIEYFNLGENKRVILKIESKLGQEFKITSASFSLIKFESMDEEFCGPCDIQENTIKAKIKPLSAGKYYLVFTYQIADEELMQTVEVLVHE